jgi:hypothetical protein
VGKLAEAVSPATHTSPCLPNVIPRPASSPVVEGMKVAAPPKNVE